MTNKRWAVLIASCIINLCIGSTYSWSVFSAPMAEYLNNLNNLSGAAAYTGSSLAIVFTVTNIFASITVLCGGAFNDKMNPRWVIFTGGLLFGAGMIICGFATNLTLLIVGYSALGSIGMGLGYACTVNNTVKFFPDKRGLAGGLTTAAYGLSSVITPPIVVALIERTSVVSTFKILGVVYAIIVCAASLVVVRCPAGFAPEGWTPSVVKNAPKSRLDVDWRGMVKYPVFYVMLIMIVCGAFAGLMAISQASPIAQNMIGMPGATAAIIVSVLALFNATGRVTSGYISDKIGRINMLTVAFVMALCGMALLYMASGGSAVLFVVGISVVGFGFGSLMGIYPGFTADQFGTKNNGMNYGFMFIGFGLAGIVAPMVASGVFASIGSYRPAFLIAAIMNVIGLCFTFVFRRMSKE